MNRLQRMLALVRSHRPGLRLVDKHDVWWMRAAGVLMRPFMPDFMDSVTTVFGDVVYLPGRPDDMPPRQLARILAHELVHQLDQGEHGLWFYVSYALFPSPFGRTLRAHWERRAYAVDLMLAHHMGGDPRLRLVHDRLAVVFGGPAYAWMWAGRRAAWAYLAPLADDIRGGTLQLLDPYADILAAWRGPSE